MPSELTIELKKKLLEFQKIREELQCNNRQIKKNGKKIEKARIGIEENKTNLQSLEEDLANESKRFEKNALQLENAGGGEVSEQLINKVEKLNEDNESMSKKITELREKENEFEKSILELTKENETLSGSNKEIEERQEKYRAQIEFLVKTAEEAEKHQLGMLKIEHDYVDEEQKQRYMLESSGDFRIFRLMFDHFIQTELLDDKKKAGIFVDALIFFNGFSNTSSILDYMLEIYHSNRYRLSLDAKVNDWDRVAQVGNEQLLYRQVLVKVISSAETERAIRLLCYGADPDVVEVTLGDNCKKLGEILAFVDEKNNTNFSALIQASHDLKIGIQHLSNRSKIEAIAKIASAMELHPAFVSEYIKTQFDFSILQITGEVPTDETDYHFVLELIDFCAYICHLDENVAIFKELIQNDILPHVIAYPLSDSKKALFKSQEEVNVFLERPYIKKLYASSSYISTMNFLVEERSISTPSTLSFFSHSTSTGGKEFEQEDRWEGPLF